VSSTARSFRSNEPEKTVAATEAPQASAVAANDKPNAALAVAQRWLRLNKGKLRAFFVGVVALALFLLAWHLLTKYRVVFFVRFTNVPSPLSVYESFTKASHDSRFLSHIGLSCRRILLGFSLAAVIAVPLGLLMGRFKLMHEVIFPVSEVLRPIPAIAWVPMAIMLWPTNEQSIVFITFLGSFFPILVNTLHGMSLVDPVLVRAARCLGAREKAYSLVQYPDIALGMIAIGVLGLASSFLIRVAGRVTMPWSRT
jgi:NitT/TauT family transport system permease protein